MRTLLFSCCILLLLAGTGCQKFDNDENASLHRAINRIEGSWEVYSWIDINGIERIDETDSMRSHYTVTFEKFERIDRKDAGYDGKFWASHWAVVTLNWRMDAKNNTLYVTSERAISVSRLDKDELWVEGSDIIEARPAKVVKLKRISE